MNARLQRRVQRYGWDKAADHYENYWREQLAPAQGRMLELADLKPGEKVLDVACGTGVVTLDAAEAVGDRGEILGTDISAAMIEKAAGAAEERGFGQCRFLRTDAEKLELPDHYFDAVLCALGLMYFPDPEACLREMLRVTRPGGRVAAAVWGARKGCGWAEIFPIVDRRVESDVCPMFFRLGTGDTLRDEAVRAGWSDPVVGRLNPILRYASADEALGAALRVDPSRWLTHASTTRQKTKLMPSIWRASRISGMEMVIASLVSSSSWEPRRADCSISVIVNLRPDQTAQVTVKISGASPKGACGKILTAPGSDSHNGFDNPSAVAPKTTCARSDMRRIPLPH